MGINIMNANVIDLINVTIIGGGAVDPTAQADGGQIVQVDYGTMKKGTDSTFLVKLSPLEGDTITKARAMTSCGCTTATPQTLGNDTLISIKYDTKRVGAIKKSVTIPFELNGEAQKIFLKLTGKVLNK